MAHITPPSASRMIEPRSHRSILTQEHPVYPPITNSCIYLPIRQSDRSYHQPICAFTYLRRHVPQGLNGLHVLQEEAEAGFGQGRGLRWWWGCLWEVWNGIRVCVCREWAWVVRTCMCAS